MGRDLGRAIALHSCDSWSKTQLRRAMRELKELRDAAGAQMSAEFLGRVSLSASCLVSWVCAAEPLLPAALRVRCAQERVEHEARKLKVALEHVTIPRMEAGSASQGALGPDALGEA